MSQTSEYAIIYLLPEPAWSYFIDLWSKVEDTFRLTGRSQPKTPPHITLKYQFMTADLTEVERALTEFAATTPPTPWAIRGYNRFISADNYVIFLEIIPTPAVRVAHGGLLERLRPIPWMQWDRYDHTDLHYHATVALRGLTDANFAAVWAFINAQPPPDFAPSFDSVALLKIDRDIDTVYKTYQLSGRSAG